METRIVKLHGCSGAGKTTLVRNILRMGEHHTCDYQGREKFTALTITGCALPIFILGSYENNCGGVDGISDAATVMEMIDTFAPVGHVIHEGLLQSTYYGAMGEHSKKYGDRYIYAFLDTPIEVCLERVDARRAAQGTTRKYNPELTERKHETIARLRRRLEAEGRHRLLDIVYSDPIGHHRVLAALGELDGIVGF